jgi:large subunit ribosomal protein L10
MEILMRTEKTSIANEVKSRLEGAPFIILTDFTGLTVQGFSELRGRLAKSNARAMVVKNSLLRLTLKELKQPDLNGALQGPTAVVFGEKDVAAAANVLKTFVKEFKKLKIKAGILDRAVLSANDIDALAELPSREVLMAQLLGVLQAPATKFVRLVNTPASQLVQVLKAKSEKAA